MLTDTQMNRIVALFEAAATQDAMLLFESFQGVDNVPATYEAQAQYIAVSERQSVQTRRDLLAYSADELLAALREKTSEPNGMFVKRELICDAERFLKELLELAENAIADCWLETAEIRSMKLGRVRIGLTTDAAHATYHCADILREKLDALLDGKE